MDHWVCPDCNKKISATLDRCPYCKRPAKDPGAMEKVAADLSKRTAAAVAGYKEESERIKMEKDQQKHRETVRKCLNCGYTGQMKTWLGDTVAGITITILLLACFIIPGLIFMAMYWGKRRCPSCGSIGKNAWADIAAQP